MAAPQPDPLTAAEAATWQLVKALADALWYIENEPRSFVPEHGSGSATSERAAQLGTGLQDAIAAFSSSIAAVPDYDASVGDKASYNARMAALYAQRTAMLPGLKRALAAKEARLQQVNESIERASRALAGLDGGAT